MTSSLTVLYTYNMFAPSEAAVKGCYPWLRPIYSDQAACHPMLQQALAFYKPLNAFDEVCFYRDFELLMGFNTMLSERCFALDPSVVRETPKLDPSEAARLYRPYRVWNEVCGSGSMGSSALATMFSSTCSAWFLELLARGWRHVALLGMPSLVFVQVCWDVVGLTSLSTELDGNSRHSFFSKDSTDHVGHLAGNFIGFVFYIGLRKYRVAKPRFP